LYKPYLEVLRRVTTDDTAEGTEKWGEMVSKQREQQENY
jgi:hypothetical protein